MSETTDNGGHNPDCRCPYCVQGYKERPAKPTLVLDKQASADLPLGQPAKAGVTVSPLALVLLGAFCALLVLGGIAVGSTIGSGGSASRTCERWNQWQNQTSCVQWSN